MCQLNPTWSFTTPCKVGAIILILWMRKPRSREVPQWACTRARIPIHTAGGRVYAISHDTLAGVGAGREYLSFSTALIAAMADLGTVTPHQDQAVFKESTTAL